MKHREVAKLVSGENVLSMFPFYRGKNKIRGYVVTRCEDPLVAPFIYPRWLAAHHRWPHNDELPLYFVKQLYAEFHLHIEVDYTSYHEHAGQGKGRFSDKPQFRPSNFPPPVDKRALVGPNLLVLPKRLELAATGEAATGSTQSHIFENIASITTQIDQISSDRVGRYLLRPRINLPPTKATSASYDPFISADLPTLADVEHMTHTTLRNMCRLSILDLLAAYQVISEDHGIALDRVPEFIRQRYPHTHMSHSVANAA